MAVKLMLLFFNPLNWCCAPGLRLRAPSKPNQMYSRHGPLLIEPSSGSSDHLTPGTYLMSARIVVTAMPFNCGDASYLDGYGIQAQCLCCETLWAAMSSRGKSNAVSWDFLRGQDSWLTGGKCPCPGWYVLLTWMFYKQAVLATISKSS